MEKQLQEIAAKLLAEKKVDRVIGYEAGYKSGVSRPAFITSPEDAKKLIMNKSCINNLTVYLPKLKKQKLAVIVKGCDLKSVKELIKEKQILRENIIIIGVVCEGVSGRGDGGKNAKKCDNCEDISVEGADFTVGTYKESGNKVSYKDVTDFEALSSAIKEEFWKKEFEKCIRCYACRNICPVCYCPDCFANRLTPEYLNKEVTPAENKVFQQIRMQHVFGRCTDCGACETACPVGIPLGLITRKLAKDAKDMFAYKSGVDMDTRPPLSTYKQDEEFEIIL